ncbi:preprotein translocase subunit SECY, chloroplastic-like isoform X2 [Eucalyptus grandis]|uniref:preprotein translocase subunit SECY, chloroplastic-like isoform X2 n=1 Tax=Eucalyptus grandis TaxID=71139 RepID=UPI00192EB71F|nr:preprotein translocase subunit SECY, chloroplastic-like isoform X2 [Eucalyptus grandis]
MLFISGCSKTVADWSNKVNSSGVMPIVFSTSSLPLPRTVARFMGLAALKKAAVTLNPCGSLYLPTNILLISRLTSRKSLSATRFQSSLYLPTNILLISRLASRKSLSATRFQSSLYLLTNILLIAFLNYYYTFLHLGPDDMSEQLKRQGVSIPLVQLGKTTAAFMKTLLAQIYWKLQDLKEGEGGAGRKFSGILAMLQSSLP